MFSRDEKPDAWLSLSMLAIMRKRYPPEDGRELTETFQRYSDSTDIEPDSLVPVRINSIKVLYLESRLLLGSHFYGP